MEAAHELIDSFPDCAFALLFSSVTAVRFYRELGWRAIAGPVLCDQPGGRIDYTKRLPTAPVMVRTADESAFDPTPPIDIRGLPW
jgi:hypothetical protein